MILQQIKNIGTVDKYFSENGKKIIYKKGQLIIRGGDEVQEFYYLHSGQVSVSILHHSGFEQIVGVFETGIIFAKPNNFIKQSFGLNYEALVDCVVYKIPASIFMSELEKNLDLSKEVNNQLLLENVKFLQQIAVLGESNSYYRMLSWIKHMSLHQGNIDKDLCTFRVSLSQQQIANILGISRECVGKNLKKIKMRNLITIKNKKFSVVSLNSLNKEVEMYEPQ